MKIQIKNSYMNYSTGVSNSYLIEIHKIEYKDKI